MNPGKVTRRGAPLRSRESSTGCASKGAYRTDTVPAARVVRAVRIGLVMTLVAVAGLRAGQAGASGERRKARFVVHLKHCVCGGKMSLIEAQAAIAGNWSAAYAGFGRSSCDVSGVNVATSSRDSEP